MLRSAVALARALLPWGLNSTGTRVLNRGCFRRFCSVDGMAHHPNLEVYTGKKLRITSSCAKKTSVFIGMASTAKDSERSIFSSLLRTAIAIWTFRLMAVFEDMASQKVLITVQPQFTVCASLSRVFSARAGAGGTEDFGTATRGQPPPQRDFGLTE